MLSAIICFSHTAAADDAVYPDISEAPHTVAKSQTQAACETELSGANHTVAASQAQSTCETELSEVIETVAESRPVTGLLTLSAGWESQKIDYLSPMRFRGTALTLSGVWTKVMPWNPPHMRLIMDASTNVASCLNASGTAVTTAGEASLGAGMLWYNTLPCRMQWGVGGGIDLTAGAEMLSRNSNNPVNARAISALRIEGYAAWPFRLWGADLLLSDRCRMPLLGAFFNPQYGESYYEIYLGNHQGLAHFAWPGNMTGVTNDLGLSLDLGRTALYLGYRYHLSTTYANHLYTEISRQSIVIGIIPHGLGMKKKRTTVPLTIIR